MRLSLLVRAVWRAILVAALALPAYVDAQSSMGTGQELFQPGTQPRDYIELRAGLIHSDNLELTSTDPVSGNIATAGLGIDFARQGPRLAFDARGDVNWEDYPSNTFGSSVLGNLDARAALALVPQTFIWNAEETFGQLVLNPLEAATPDNLENVYYFTTGPDLTVRLDGANSLELGARYSKTNSSDHTLDGNRYRGDLAFIHALSSLSRLSMHVDADRYSFSGDAMGSDFDRAEAYGHFEVRGARTDMSIDAGYTQIKPAGDSSQGGALARLSLTRRVSPSMRAGLFAHTEFSDSADELRGSAVQADPLHPGSVLAASDPYKSSAGGLRWDFQRGRTSLGVQVERTREVHQQLTTFNRNATTWSANAERRLRPQLTLTASVSRVQESYFVTGFSDRLLTASAALEWAFGRTLNVRLRYDRTDRSAAIFSSEFTENRLGLYGVWAPFGRH